MKTTREVARTAARTIIAGILHSRCDSENVMASMKSPARIHFSASTYNFYSCIMLRDFGSESRMPSNTLPFNPSDASKLAEAASDRMMDTARLLREIRDRRSKDLPEAARLARIGLRKAHTLARIAALFDSLGIPDDRLEKIGWAKLDIIGGHLAEDARNAGELLTLAESFSQLELKARLQGQVPETRHGSMLLHLPEDEDQRFRKLLLQFGARTKGKGLVNKEAALIALMDAFDANASGDGQ